MGLFERDPGLPSKNPSRSAWLDENPLKNYKHSDSLPSYSDVVIIGSGFSGASTSYHLLVDPRTRLSNIRRSADQPLSDGKLVTLLEAREACSGATGRNGGHLIPANYRDFIADTEAFNSPMRVAAIRYMEQIGALEVRNFIIENKIDCEFRFEGNLQVYSTQADFDHALKNLEAARSWGIGGQQVYTRQDLQNLFGPNENFGGIKIPGGQVFPAKLIWFMLFQAINAGLNLYTNTPVTKVALATREERQNLPSNVQNGNLWCVTTESGEKIYTSKVVHATNAYASHILPDYRTHIFPVRAQVLSPAAEYTNNRLFPFGLSLRHGLEYAIQRDYPNGALILGGRRTSSKSLEVDTADDSVVNPNLSRDLREDFKKPEFSHLGLDPQNLYNVREWTGIMGFSDDTLPYVGEVVTRSGETLEGQYILAGFTGHGMPKCFRCGREIARLIKESFMTPEEIRNIKYNSNQSVNPASFEAIIERSQIYNPTSAVNQIDSSLWASIGTTNADTWDFPILKVMHPTPDRMRTVNTSTWKNRDIIPDLQSNL
ncbi:hypothetical protein BB559_006494 [Furculomyces boomerangus]|uniref:FAD dependent oxidoreductase domain-containing protein n=2 Tax=Harpellales TaxID=61421 RepID=A0A2T9Y2C1_9FUNG|nr:hypothetical protein BB559_006494 [Furculomyces boomerangus]PWA01460.1 hypothetical protein BB558_002438 [Smittium angustum]